MLYTVSISRSAASLGLKRIEGRVKGLLSGSASACMRVLIACNCEEIEVAIVRANKQLKMELWKREVEKPVKVWYPSLDSLLYTSRV